MRNGSLQQCIALLLYELRGESSMVCLPRWPNLGKASFPSFTSPVCWQANDVELTAHPRAQWNHCKDSCCFCHALGAMYKYISKMPSKFHTPNWGKWKQRWNSNHSRKDSPIWVLGWNLSLVPPRLCNACGVCLNQHWCCHNWVTAMPGACFNLSLPVLIGSECRTRRREIHLGWVAKTL